MIDLRIQYAPDDCGQIDPTQVRKFCVVYELFDVDQSPVGLVVTEGTKITWDTASRHDEGWSQTALQWWIEKDENGKWTLWLERNTDGHDCDGRLTSHDLFSCELEETEGSPMLQIKELTERDYPHAWMAAKWTAVSARQRDMAAERAGY